MTLNDRKTKTTTSGPGGAHVSWRMFGARGPLLDEHDSGGGSAGGGSSSSTTATTTATTGSEGGDTAGNSTAGGTGAKFTPEQQAEVNRIAARAREEGRQAATTAPKEKPPAASSSTKSESSELADLRREMEFKEIAGDLGIPREARKDLYDLVKVQQPADMAQWLESKRGTLWSKPAQQSTTTTTTTPNSGTTTDPGKTAATAPSTPAKVDMPTSGGLTDIWNLSLEQVKQLGPAGLRVEQEKIIAHARASSGAPPVPKVLQRK